MVRRVHSRIARSLRWRFALSMAALVAVVGGAIALVGSDLLEDTLIEAHAEATERLALYIHSQMEATQDPVELERVIGATTKNVDGLIGAGVYTLIPSTPMGAVTARVGDAPAVVLFDPEDPTSRIQPRVDGPETLEIAMPSPDGTRIVLLSRSLEECDAVEDRAQLVLLALAAVFVALGALFGDRLAQLWLRPLRDLMNAMRNVTNGRFGTRVETTDRSELGELSRRFNMMSRALERHREEAEHHTAQLERRVQTRTAELERANNALRSLDRAKDAFLSNVSHEMRTPLTSILASVEILGKFDGGDPATRAEFLSIVDQESKRLLELIDDVLEIVALEAAPMVIRPQRHDLGDLVRRVISGVTARATAREVTILLHSADDRATIACDVERITQVLDGLLDNAIKFSPIGATVDLTTEVSDGAVQVKVRDEGPGLEAAEAERVFAKFAQVGRSLSDKPSGFGLGLPFARKIAEAHSGSIAYEREPGFGATFVLTLPIAADDEAEAAGGAASAARETENALLVQSR